MSKTCLFLLCHTNTSIHKDSDVYIVVPHSNRCSVYDSLIFTGYGFLSEAFKCNFRFTIAPPYFFTISVKRLPHLISRASSYGGLTFPSINFLWFRIYCLSIRTEIEYFHLLFIIQVLTIYVPLIREKLITLYPQIKYYYLIAFII